MRDEQPQQITRAMDALFTMKDNYVKKILNTADFWWYYIARRDAGNLDWAEAIVGYDKEHIQRGTTFKP